MKEVWKVAQPLDRVIHTMGWPLRAGAKYREFGGSFIYPMGDDMVTLGLVVGLDYRDAELSVHDLLQELKTHPLVRSSSRAASASPGARRRSPRAASSSLPKRLHAPGLLICRRRRGARQRAGAEGHPLRGRVGQARGRGGLLGAAARASLRAGAARSPATTRRCSESFVWSDLKQVRNMRPAFGARLLARRRDGRRDDREPRRPSRAATRSTEPDADQDLIRTDRAKSYPAPDGKLTFDKLSSVFLSGNATRDDAPNHIRVQRRGAAGDRRAVDAHVPGAGLRGRRERATAVVEVTPSNCVQCGAITAKGGRLTPPEGGVRGPGRTSSPDLVELADVEAAREAIGGRLHRTPMFSSATLGERTRRARLAQGRAVPEDRLVQAARAS